MVTATRRAPQQRGLETRDRLVAAAIQEFAAHGYGGASTRAIARRAEVAQSAIPFHFSTKEALWKAAAEDLLGRLRSCLESRSQGLDGVDSATRVRLILLDYVRFAAQHPALHRFMVQESTAPSDRLTWLVETHVRPLFRQATKALEALEDEGIPLPARGEELVYMLIGAATTSFTLAPEFRLITNRDPLDAAAVEAHAESVVRTFFPALMPALPSASSSPR